MTVKTKYEHISIDNKNVAIISGSGTKVIELILDYLAYGWSPEEMHFQHPHLSLGQIHSALAYYWDHQEEFNKDVDRRLARVEKLGENAGKSPLQQRLHRDS